MKKTLFIRPPVFLLLFMSTASLRAKTSDQELTATILHLDI